MCLVITCNVSSLTVYMAITGVASQLQGSPVGAPMFNVKYLKMYTCTHANIHYTQLTTQSLRFDPGTHQLLPTVDFSLEHLQQYIACVAR